MLALLLDPLVKEAEEIVGCYMLEVVFFDDFETIIVMFWSVIGVNGPEILLCQQMTMSNPIPNSNP